MQFDIQRIIWDWFWWVEPKGVRVRFSEVGGVVTVRTAEGALEILSIDRWRHYKRGIAHRSRRLAGQYGVPQKVSIRPGDVVVDAGANIGEFSLYAADAGAHVIAIEPDPFTLARLRANTAGRDIEIVPVGLWDTCTTLRFNIDPFDANGSFINASTTFSEIEAVTLDTVIAPRNIDRIRLIKADGEGAEPEILRGASETLKITEFVTLDCGKERNGQSTLDDCITLLTEAGFAIVHKAEYRFNLVARNRFLTDPLGPSSSRQSDHSMTRFPTPH